MYSFRFDFKIKFFSALFISFLLFSSNKSVYLNLKKITIFHFAEENQALNNLWLGLITI